MKQRFIYQRAEQIMRALICCALLVAAVPIAVAQETPSDTGGYPIQPGDRLRVSVWKEPDLQQDLLVRPDGGISFPLAGDLAAADRTVQSIQDDLVSRLEEYIPDPVVTVQVLETQGNTIYVLGKVNRPGAFVMSKTLDVTQALALAGGLAVFADKNDISVLRRTGGSQQAISFEYGEVEYGRALEQNILLMPGDVIVVP